METTNTHAAPRQPGEDAVSTSWVLAALALCTLLPALGISIANVALPTLAEAFAVTFQQVQWVVLAYLLASTVLVVGVGRLGDIAGRRRLLLAGLVLFTAASVLGGVSADFRLLVAARAAQGLGAAIMTALAMALVGDAVPRHRTGRAMGLLATMSATGTALGPSLGGLLIAGFGWRAIFAATAALGIATLPLAWRHLPADRQAPAAQRMRYDKAGTLLLALSLAAYALAMTAGRGSFGLHNAALLAAAAGGLGLFVLVEAKTASPLIRLSRLREPALAGGLATSALVSAVMMATLVVGPFYLSRGLGLGPALVGITMSVGPLVVALSGVPAGRLVDRFGARRTTLAGLAALAAGSGALSLTPDLFGLGGYLAPIVVATAGYALFQAGNNTAVMIDVAADQRGAISGLLALSRHLGFITGASALAAVFAFACGTADFTAASADGVASGMRAAFAVALLLVVAALAIAVAGRAPARAAQGCAS